MKILSASQMRSADAYTIQHEPVSSIDLMERAAAASVKWILNNTAHHCSFIIFCGPGNNGGDGLAIARMLLKSGSPVSVYIAAEPVKYSVDFLENERRLRDAFPASINQINTEKDFPAIDTGDTVIDAIFGTGLSKPVSGLYSKVIGHIYASGANVISIDIPSGLYADRPPESVAVIHAHHTLSFQCPKLAFMFAENEKYVGDFHLLDIGLDQKFIEGLPVSDNYITRDFIKSFLKPRKKFSHKGIYGHALIVAGSKGKMGAAVLAAGGCLRTGVGLLTMQIPESGIDIMQVSCPEAMLASEEHDFEIYASAGIGPGLGVDETASKLIKRLFHEAKFPLVIDADALNIISKEKELLNQIPVNSIITPHPKEFERLAGKSRDDFERHEKQILLSKTHKIFVVLKGAHTCITTPDGFSYFNSTGNAGMAKGGSGDVLTGMITSLLAQGYTSLESSLLAVYFHGLAGDIAAAELGMDGMIATDIVNAIPEAWKRLRNV